MRSAREPERLAGPHLQREPVKVVTLDDPGGLLPYPHLVVLRRLGRKPFGELVDAGIVEGQIHPDAVPSPCQPSMMPSGRCLLKMKSMERSTHPAAASDGMRLRRLMALSMASA